MRRPSVARALAAACVVSTLLSAPALAGSKKKADPIGDLRVAIAKNVADPQRATRMTASVDELEGLIRELGALALRQRDAVAPLLRDYTKSREEVEAKLAEFNEQRNALAKKALDVHAAFKRAATADEWWKLAKTEERALAYVAATSVGTEPFLDKEK